MSHFLDTLTNTLFIKMFSIFSFLLNIKKHQYNFHFYQYYCLNNDPTSSDKLSQRSISRRFNLHCVLLSHPAGCTSACSVPLSHPGGCTSVCCVPLSHPSSCTSVSCVSLADVWDSSSPTINLANACG